MMIVIAGGLAGVLVGCALAYFIGRRAGKQIGERSARLAQLPYHRREWHP